MKILSRISSESKPEHNMHKFIVYFLYDDEEQDVHVDEVEEIDLPKVIQHLVSGGSVFISHRENPERYETFCADGELVSNEPETQ